MSSFDQPIPTFIMEAGLYLDARTLTIDLANILPGVSQPMGWFIRDDDGNFVAFIPMGWAFDLGNGHYQMRVCNYPKDGRPLYVLRGKKYVRLGTPPKFLTSPGSPTCYLLSAPAKLTDAPVVYIHEKVTASLLCEYYTDAPCITLLGCYGWSHKGQPSAELKHMVAMLAQGAEVFICFDGDLNDPAKRVGQAAAGLTYQLGKRRPDLRVKILDMPELKGQDGQPRPNPPHGWDDWLGAVHPEQLADLLNQAQSGPGLTVAQPLEYWRDKGLNAVANKEGQLTRLEANPYNYRLLLREAPWNTLYRDISGGFYRFTGQPDPLLACYAPNVDALALYFIDWAHQHVYAGMGVTIRRGDVRSLLQSHYTTTVPARCSIVEQIKQHRPVSQDELLAAVDKLLTEGIRIKPTLPREELIETWIRVCRDMLYLWDEGDASHVQWVLGLIGPSGAGKTSLFQLLLSPYAFEGFVPPITTALDEIIKHPVRSCRDHRVVIFDDLHNMTRLEAHKLETLLYTLATQSTGTLINVKFKEDMERANRHAGYVLTTTPHHRELLYNAAGSGERRFIMLEIEGVVLDERGLPGPDMALIRTLAPIIWRGAWQRMDAQDKRPATEYSIQIVGDYLATPWALEELRKVAAHHPHDFRLRLEALDREASIAGERRLDPYRMFSLLLSDDPSHGRNLPATLRGSFIEYMVKDVKAVVRDKSTRINVPHPSSPDEFDTQTRRRVLILPEDWIDRIMASL